MQNLKEAIGVESRTTLLNPEYIKEKMKGGATSAGTFAKTLRNTYGWNIMKPTTIDKELWDDLYKVYVKDELHLGIHSFFKKENPAALQEMTAVMLETARKGYWKATNEQLKDLAALHIELIKEFRPACSGFVCDNGKLEDFIAGHTDAQATETYRRQINTVKEAPVETGKSVVLKKDRLDQTPEQEQNDLNGFVVAVAVVAIFCGIVLFMKRKKR